MTVTHRSISVATEGSYGSINAATGIPTPPVTWLSLPAERDAIVSYGEPVVSERVEAADGPHQTPSEVDTIYLSGNRVQRRTGEVTLKIDFTSLGGATDYLSTGIGQLLNGAFQSTIPGTGNDTVDFAGTANRYNPTLTPGSYKLGGILGTVINNRPEYSAVTSLDPDGTGTLIGYSPAFSAALAPTDATYLLNTWFIPRGTNSGGMVSSLAFRIDGVNTRTYAYGCRLSALNITLDNSRLMGEFTYTSSYIVDDHGSAAGPVEPAAASGSAAHFRGCYVVLSSTASSSRTAATGDPGDELARTALDVSEMSLSITQTLSPVGTSNTILGMSDLEVSGVEITCDLTVDTPSALVADDFLNAVHRSLTIGTNPLGTNQGMALQIPAAFLTVDPKKYEISGEVVQQKLSYSAGRYSGDNGSTDAANTLFRLGMGL